MTGSLRRRGSDVAPSETCCSMRPRSSIGIIPSRALLSRYCTWFLYHCGRGVTSIHRPVTTRRVYVLNWERSFAADTAAEALPGFMWSNGFSPEHLLCRHL